MAIAVTVPETWEVLELEEEFRRTKLAEAVIVLLAVLLPQAGLITIEDVHFMDEASADLFSHLGGAADHPAALVPDQAGRELGIHLPRTLPSPALDPGP